MSNEVFYFHFNANFFVKLSRAQKKHTEQFVCAHFIGDSFFFSFSVV